MLGGVALWVRHQLAAKTVHKSSRTRIHIETAEMVVRGRLWVWEDEGVGVWVWVRVGGSGGVGVWVRVRVGGSGGVGVGVWVWVCG
jgi:hypothetical protein